MWATVVQGWWATSCPAVTRGQVCQVTRAVASCQTWMGCSQDPEEGRTPGRSPAQLQLLRIVLFGKCPEPGHASGSDEPSASPVNLTLGCFLTVRVPAWICSAGNQSTVKTHISQILGVYIMPHSFWVWTNLNCKYIRTYFPYCAWTKHLLPASFLQGLQKNSCVVQLF